MPTSLTSGGTVCSEENGRFPRAPLPALLLIAVGTMAGPVGCSGEPPKLADLHGAVWHGTLEAEGFDMWIAFDKSGNGLTSYVAHNGTTRTGKGTAHEDAAKHRLTLVLDAGSAVVESTDRVVADVVVKLGSQRVKVTLARTTEEALQTWRDHHAAAPSIVTPSAGAGGGLRDKLPKEFPTDLPVYADSEVREAVFWNPSGTRTIALRTRATFEIVHDFYRQQLTQHGWHVVHDDEAPGGAHLRAEKDSRRVDIGIARPADDPLPSTRIHMTDKDSPLKVNFSFMQDAAAQE